MLSILWGENSFRVRMTKEAQMDAHDWALTEEVKMCPLQVECKEVDTTDPWYKGEEFAKYHQTGKVYTVKNGKITAVISPEGWISYYNQKGELLTEEYWRNRNRINRYCVPLRIDARELKPIPGSTDYELTMRFEAFDDEKIFGMGQYQEKNLNKKGAMLELAHRNSQASVPFIHGEDEDDPPRHAGIHHRLEPEQRLAVDLEETHHGYEEHTDARVPDGLEEAGDAGRGGQDVGQKQQDDQREQEPQHDFLDFIQPQRTFRVQSFRIQRDQFLHVGLEHVLGHDDEQQGAQRAACYRNDHVLRVIDGHAGHVFIRAEYGKRNLLP